MIYVMSDIHGNMRRFNSIMEQINLQPEDTLYILGDVIDRHPNGLRILRKLMVMPNAKMLLGNHEYMMLQTLGEGYDNDSFYDSDSAHRYDLWYRNGGEVTHRHWKHLRKDLRKGLLSVRSSAVRCRCTVGRHRLNCTAKAFVPTPATGKRHRIRSAHLRPIL